MTITELQKKLLKEIGDLKNKVYQRLKSNKCPKEYKEENWEEYYEGNLIRLNAKLEGYKLAQKEIIEKIDIFPVGEVICKYNLHRNPKRFSDMINDIFEELKKFISSGNPNKKGCGKMYCSIEGCGRIDESHSAHCVKHNRSPHNICGENGLCSNCSLNTTGERDG